MAEENGEKEKVKKYEKAWNYKYKETSERVGEHEQAEHVFSNEKKKKVFIGWVKKMG